MIILVHPKYKTIFGTLLDYCSHERYRSSIFGMAIVVTYISFVISPWLLFCINHHIVIALLNITFAKAVSRLRLLKAIAKSKGKLIDIRNKSKKERQL